MALSVKQLQDKKARLLASLVSTEAKAEGIKSDISEVEELLQGKVAELQAQMDEINGTNTNTTEEVI